MKYPTDYEDEERLDADWQEREDAIEYAEHIAQMKQDHEPRFCDEDGA